ncbi:hypothetical protein ACKVEX_00095 [Rhodocyclaceae bacterium SMB388]
MLLCAPQRLSNPLPAIGLLIAAGLVVLFAFIADRRRAART